MRKTIIAGLAVRSEIRRWLLSENIDFVEDKGLVDSLFALKCSDETYKKVVKALEVFNK